MYLYKFPVNALFYSVILMSIINVGGRQILNLLNLLCGELSVNN